MITVEQIETEERFDALREDWALLLAASPSNGLFLTWEWMSTWWRHLGRGRLAVSAVRSGSELVALAPFAAGRAPSSPLFETLTFLGSGMVGSDYLDLIVRPGWEAAAGDALARDMVRRKSRLELHRTPRRRGLQPLLDHLGTRGWTVAVTSTDVCPFIRLAGHTWKSYLATVSRRHRANYGQHLRRLEREGDVRLELATDEPRRRTFLATLLAQHKEYWRGRGGTQAFADPAVEAFHDEMTRAALARGWLRLYALLFDGQPAALLYGFRYGGTFYFYQAGWDLRFARRSVGLLLQGLVIRAAIEEQVEEFDFLHGSEAYKFLWASDVRELFRAEAYPPTMRGTVQRYVAGGLRTGRSLARKALNRARPAPAKEERR